MNRGFCSYPCILPGNRRVKHIKRVFFRCLSRGNTNSKYNYFFTLHKQLTNENNTFSFEDEAFYTSEVCLESINPVWKDINIESEIPKDIINNHTFLLCLHRKTEEGDEKCCDRKIDLRTLVHLPIPLEPIINKDDIIDFIHVKAPNTHIIQLSDGYYVTETVANDMKQINNFPKSIKPINPNVNEILFDDYRRALSSLKSTKDSILKQEAQKSEYVKQLEQVINDKRNENLELIEKRFILKNYNEKQYEYETYKSLYDSQLYNIQELETENNDRIDSIMALLDKMSTWQDELEKIDTSKKIVKEHITQEHGLLVARQLKILAVLYCLYTITYDSQNNLYKIKGIPFPDNLYDNNKNEVYINCSLGYISHLVLLLAKYFNVELPYTLFYIPSQSYIEDYSTMKTIEYPLFVSSTNKVNIDKSIDLLRLDIKAIFDTQQFSMNMNDNVLKSLYEFFKYLLFLH